MSDESRPPYPIGGEPPFELEVTIPVYQWGHRNAVEWTQNFMLALEKTMVVANGGGLHVPTPRSFTLRRVGQ